MSSVSFGATEFDITCEEPSPRGGSLIVTIGNELRSDDGVGHVVGRLIADALPEDWTLMPTHQLLPDLAADMARYDRVFFVDARLPDDDPEVHVYTIEPASEDTPLGHAVSPAHLIAMTHALYDHAPLAVVMSLPTASFDYGFELSPTARRGAHRAAELLLRMISKDYGG